MADERPSRIGTLVAGKYRVEAELGRGGMGAVYRVTHVQVHKQFALKVLHEELAENREAALRFSKEAQVAGRIGHPAILDIYDVGECEDGALYMLMELLRGRSLAAELEGDSLDADRATWITSEILGALAAAHEVGVLHRDVKPQNVFLADAGDGRRAVKLLDFGIAKFQDVSDESALTRTGKIVGSPLYMAPEQARAESDIDARVDVWSVGATLYEMLTGTAAHRASSPVAVLARVLTEPAPLLSTVLAGVHPELDAFVERSLKISRSERFGSAREMLEALGRVRVALGLGDAPPPTFAPRRPSFPREAASAHSDRHATRTSDGTSATKADSASTSASKRLLLVAAVVGLLGLAVGVVTPLVFGRADPRTANGTPEASQVSRSPSVARAPRSAAPSAESPAPAPPAIAAPETREAPSAKRELSTASPRTMRPTCSPSEVLSFGHCCPRGMVWQNARCERPLATSF